MNDISVKTERNSIEIEGNYAKYIEYHLHKGCAMVRVPDVMPEA